MTTTDSDNCKRIVIPPRTFRLLTDEVLRIRQKGDNFKVNEARLAIAILDLFFDRFIEKQRDRLEKIFFDKRAFLKRLIASAEDDAELSSSVTSYLKLAKTRRPRAKKDAVG